MPNVVECDKWLFEYYLGPHYCAESYDWAPKAMTRNEAIIWFTKTFDHNTEKCLCVGESRVRK